MVKQLDIFDNFQIFLRTKIFSSRTMPYVQPLFRPLLKAAEPLPDSYLLTADSPGFPATHLILIEKDEKLNWLWNHFGFETGPLELVTQHLNIKSLIHKNQPVYHPVKTW